LLAPALKVDCHMSPDAAQRPVTSVAEEHPASALHIKSGLCRRTWPSTVVLWEEVALSTTTEEKHTQRKERINVYLCASMCPCADVTGADESKAHSCT